MQEGAEAEEEEEEEEEDDDDGEMEGGTTAASMPEADVFLLLIADANIESPVTDSHRDVAITIITQQQEESFTIQVEGVRTRP